MGVQELITVMSQDLEVGDKFWRSSLAWTVVGEPVHSINTKLYPDEGSQVIVVPVEYEDKSRGSRLFRPDTEISVAR